VSKKVDLRVTMCGLSFKNPVLAASSEVSHDARDVRRCVESGFGGVVLKTCAHEHVPIAGRRVVPNMASLRFLGREFVGSAVCDMITSNIRPDEYIGEQVPQIVELCRKADVRVIGSIAASHEVEDWIELARRFSLAGVDMLEVNMSCPHKLLTREGGEVGMAIGADPELATRIIRAVKAATHLPVAVKMTPNLEPAGYYAGVYEKAGADALSAHSTPLGLVIDTEREEVFGTYSAGYLPGRAFVPLSLGKVAEMVRTVRVPVSGTGGIIEAEDALQYILVGCPTIQLCTAVLIYGYGVVGKILKGITRWMEIKGYRGIEEFRGKVKPQDPEEIPLWEPFEFLPPDVALPPARIEIDKGKCTLCRTCTDACLYRALEIDGKNGEVMFHNDRCYNCGMCVGLCRKGALRLVERETGDLVWDGRGMQKKLLPGREGGV